VEEIKEILKKRIETHKLNVFLKKMLEKYHPPMIKGKRLKIYYLTQVGILPSKFILFVNNPNLLGKTYQRYLLNQFQKVFKLKGASIVFKVKRRT
jgi:GTP-binding protein